MATTNIVTLPNLGNDFNIGVIEANKIHLNVDGTSIIRDAGTGVLSVSPAGLSISNDLAFGGTSLTSTVNGQEATVDLTALVQKAETLTSMTYDTNTKMLAYADEHGGLTSVDLSALAVDIFVNGASFDAASLVLTLTDTDAGTPDVTVDLSTLKVTLTDNGDGTFTIAQGANSYTFDTKEGVSADAGNLLLAGTDAKPLLNPGAVRALLDVEVKDAFGNTLYFAASTNA